VACAYARTHRAQALAAAEDTAESVPGLASRSRGVRARRLRQLLSGASQTVHASRAPLLTLRRACSAGDA
jgi:hypothetical protein